MSTELSPEEKQKIYLEEKERMDAQKKLKGENQSFKFAYYLGLIGSGLLCIGLFLPWATLGAIEVSGFAKSADTKIILVIGILAFILSALGLSQEKKYGVGLVFCGFIAGVLLLYNYIMLDESLAGIKVMSAQAQVGSGFWLSAAGAFLIVIGAAKLSEKKKKK